MPVTATSFALTAALQLIAIGSIAAPPLKVMSFNLRGDFDEGRATDKPTAWISTSGEHRRELAVRVVRDYAPDLLGVQEAYANQVRELDETLPGHGVYAVGRDDGAAAGEHCAVYYRRDRFERVSDGTFWLSNEPDRPSRFPGAACQRIASWVVLRDLANGGAGLFVLNTHWDHVSREAREHSARLIRERVGEIAGDRPAIVMGDLNAYEQDAPLRTLIGDGRLVDSFRTRFPDRGESERTYHGFKGDTVGSRIDFILHGRGIRTIDAGIVRTRIDGEYPSDHYPVTASLEYANGSVR